MNIKKILSCAIFFPIFFSIHAEIIEKINFVGLNLVAVDVIAPYMSLSVGQDVQQEDIHAQITALYETGLFKQVEISVEDGGSLLVTLTEQPVIQQIKIDNNVLPDDQIKKQMDSAGLIKADLLNEQSLEQFRVMSQYSLRQSGFPNAEVETRIEAVGDSVAVIHVVVHEGSSTKLRYIEFEGDSQITELEMRRHLLSQTTGLLSFVTMSDLFSEQQLIEDRNRLIQLHQLKGYLAPSIHLHIESVTPHQRIWQSLYKKATFTIDSGPKFYVDSIKFDDVQDAWPEDLKAILLPKINGVILDKALVASLKETLMSYYYEDKLKDFYQIALNHEITGYDKVELTLVLNKEVNEVRFIDFYGNKSTHDEPLRRALKVDEAKPFTPAMIAKSERSLKNLGYLKNASIESIAVGENLYDMQVTLTEAQTIQMDANIDFGSALSSGSFEKLQLKGMLADQNAFGSGNAVSVELAMSYQQQQVNCSYIQPNVTISGHSLSNLLSFSRKSKSSDEDKQSYHVDSFNYALGYSIPYSDHLRADLGAGIIWDNYFGVESASALVRSYFDKHSTSVEQYKLMGGLSYRNIDSAYMPTHGLTAAIGGNVTLPYKDSITYLENTAEIIGYYPLGTLCEQPVVLRGRIVGQYVRDYRDSTEEIAFFSRYKAGGVGSIRGYSDFGPTFEDTTPDTASPGEYIKLGDKPKGGNKLFVMNTEIQLPSPYPDFILPYVFVDVANVFDDSEIFTFESLRGSVGLSATLKLPMVVLTGAIAMPFNKHEKDTFEEFSFGVGVMF